MVKVSNEAPVIEGCTPETLPVGELLAAARPTVLRGLARRWGLVEAGLRSVDDAMNYLRSFYNGKVLSASFAPAGVAGRLFYNDDFTRLNFEARRTTLGDVLDEIRAHLDEEDAPTRYIGSTLIDAYLPGLRRDNDLGLAAYGIDAPPAIWIGNRTIATCHYDAPNNIACVAVGRRRFTLFPPDQVANLYPGPMELNPGGQVVSLVDFSNPDFGKFPDFRAALAAGYSAELEPGDAMFVPSMWWHHVEGLSPFNTLVNYWWSSMPKYIPSPMSSLYHAMWTIRDRSEAEKQAWRQVFEYYVFGPAPRAGEHLPEKARGLLGPIDENRARQIRAMLLNSLNR
ncbi:MAG TPA: cupin-like domain-containing protein [Steroidobacteraceae bacterium]|nr:cupin-like domain-containing protein [Steroidobacteraceae bacterium]